VGGVSRSNHQLRAAIYSCADVDRAESRRGDMSMYGSRTTGTTNFLFCGSLSCISGTHGVANLDTTEASVQKSQNRIKDPIYLG
jgi:hypothetical protein